MSIYSGGDILKSCQLEDLYKALTEGDKTVGTMRCLLDAFDTHFKRPNKQTEDEMYINFLTDALKPIIEEYNDWKAYTNRERNHDRTIKVLGILIARLYYYANPKIRSASP